MQEYKAKGEKRMKKGRIWKKGAIGILSVMMALAFILTGRCSVETVQAVTRINTKASIEKADNTTTLVLNLEEPVEGEILPSCATTVNDTEKGTVANSSTTYSFTITDYWYDKTTGEKGDTYDPKHDYTYYATVSCKATVTVNNRTSTTRNIDPTKVLDSVRLSTTDWESEIDPLKQVINTRDGLEGATRIQYSADYDSTVNWEVIDTIIAGNTKNIVSAAYVGEDKKPLEGFWTSKDICVVDTDTNVMTGVWEYDTDEGRWAKTGGSFESDVTYRYQIVVEPAKGYKFGENPTLRVWDRSVGRSTTDAYGYNYMTWTRVQTLTDGSIVFAGPAFTAYANTDVWKDNDKVAIDSRTFPDEAFCAYVKANFDEDKDGILQKDEALSAYSIFIPDGCGNLNGIEYFMNLNYLGVTDASNGFTADLRKNKMLRELSLISSKDSEIGDVSFNTEITSIYIDTEYMRNVDVQNCKNLDTLELYGVNSHSVNLAYNKKLRILSVCGFENLSKLDLSYCMDLEELTYGGNGTISLDVSGHKKLVTFQDTFYKSELDRTNRLEKLNLKDCPQLNDVYLSHTIINKELDLSNCTSLKDLTIFSTSQIPLVELSDCTDLTSFTYHNDALYYLNMSGCSSLTSFDINMDTIKALYLSGTGMDEIAYSFPVLDYLDVSNCTD
ncbi:MAG: hypothetical protein IJ821_06030 [Lachnospiraceae bacterium]|nr:hypothetical protein [Lachnospiraceae bacterium]